MRRAGNRIIAPAAIDHLDAGQFQARNVHCLGIVEANDACPCKTVAVDRLDIAERAPVEHGACRCRQKRIIACAAIDGVNPAADRHLEHIVAPAADQGIKATCANNRVGSVSAGQVVIARPCIKRRDSDNVYTRKIQCIGLPAARNRYARFAVGADRFDSGK